MTHRIGEKTVSKYVNVVAQWNSKYSQTILGLFQYFDFKMKTKLLLYQINSARNMETVLIWTWLFSFNSDHHPSWSGLVPRLRLQDRASNPGLQQRAAAADHLCQLARLLRWNEGHVRERSEVRGLHRRCTARLQPSCVRLHSPSR